MVQNNLAESIEMSDQKESQKQLHVVQEALFEDTQENEQRSSLAFSEKLLKQEEEFKKAEERAIKQAQEEYKQFYVSKENESRQLDMEIAKKRRELENIEQELKS